MQVGSPQNNGRTTAEQRQEKGRKKAGVNGADLSKAGGNALLQPTFPYSSSVRYPYETRIYLDKKAKGRHFTEE